MNYATIKPVDIANGPGVRVSLFVSGCRHHCRGCFNAQAWDFEYGEPFTEAVWQQIFSYLDHDYMEGITLLGGEPMEPENQAGLLPFLTEQKKRFPKKTIWCFSGYDFEKDILGRMMQESEVTRELVPLFDVLVDGKFVEDLKNLSLKFRGSENQRILDVPRSLAAGKAVWMEQYR
ncbi:anaerobic ribonucleoside-triphosphate reductase activating protein [Clostridium sp. AF27-2AA]|jgi:anaerobic ribonucleoside-triphosphate reductase activating protein|uniref:anaerobic ribonucleoside-triphosphate reductase activating protein n=1 Tax=Clostridium sp. AF27-2AA TaxID=2292206 RepID=UPI000E490F69|nr:anaerobic ribonucleoside-triphosphate reductase activating protein [Clostridium sp. AF27-2AA]RHQ32247.1 anaerobic ribonucleoside-triphosphate reductase activating protein [Clostridium sp. AF27-2AA]